MSIQATGRNYNHTVAFRLNDEQSILADALRTTFPEASWSVSFRWLLDQPAVRAVIAARVRGDEPPTVTPSNDAPLEIIVSRCCTAPVGTTQRVTDDGICTAWHCTRCGGDAGNAFMSNKGALDIGVIAEPHPLAVFAEEFISVEQVGCDSLTGDEAHTFLLGD